MVLFEERQKANQWWLWLILLGSLALTVVATYPLLATDQAWAAWLSIGIVLLITVLVAGATLQTTITNRYIRVSCTSIFSRTIDWDDVAKAHVRKYKPLAEYGGWGYRISPPNGTAYNMMGNQGLQLILKNGERILIGTQEPEHLAEVLQRMYGGAAGATPISEAPIPLRERLKG